MATSFYSRYPSAGGASSNAANGTTGQTAPTTATEVGFVDGSGNLQPFSGTSASSGPNVAVTSSALPAGAATSANQSLEITQLTAINSNTTGSATAANQVSGNTSAATTATNTGTIATNTNVSTNGAATSALQTSGNTSAATTATNTGTIATNTGTIATNTNVSTNGAATSALQTSGNTTLTTISTSINAGQGTVAAGVAGTKSNLIGGVYNSTLPTLTTGQQAAIQLDVNGRQILGASSALIGSVAQNGTWTSTLNASTASIGTVGRTGSTGNATPPVYNNYATTNVTTATYLAIVTSTTGGTNYIDIFDSSGQAMILATGAAGSEVILAYIPPGGDQIQAVIPASTRVSIKALTANATSGYLLVNLWK